ncbi:MULTISPECIES: HupE/UreJ family protein [Flammeovirga]|uniref:HupE/UreJ family protein n=1 Tax=Flammeovirga agarivorans TaxID=2726742 RepID=A0A7X8SI98_9BACT|nr:MULTISPECIES: HupE/UreJ family protein [Flammeovirga]NLR90627.1 HupE/UreJ family protein [Flammeovirga agarivorans]
MSEFWLYLQLGLEHITDVKGYDHILFILALVATFSTRDLKKVIWLVTAFTLGHSITLALSTLDIVNIDADLIETLIPVTIIIVCISNLFNSVDHKNRPHYLDKRIPFRRYYIEASVFGLIHGLGFSNYLKSLLGSGENIVEPLLAFNLGLELGQIVIVLIIMLINLIVMRMTMWSQRDWNFFVTGGAMVSAILILVG